jgi:hypothetical protein
MPNKQNPQLFSLRNETIFGRFASELKTNSARYLGLHATRGLKDDGYLSTNVIYIIKGGWFANKFLKSRIPKFAVLRFTVTVSLCGIKTSANPQKNNLLFTGF